MDKQNHEMRKLKVHEFLKPDITKELNPLFSDLQTEPYLETMEFLHRNNIQPRNNRKSEKKPGSKSPNVLFQVLKPVLGFWLGRVSEPIFQAADRLLQVLKKILSKV